MIPSYRTHEDERAWVEAHREEFLGQWVALDGGNLVAHGTDARTVFSTEPKREEAKSVVRNAHLIMLTVLSRQLQHFKLDLEDEAMERAKELDDCWLKDEEAHSG